MTLQEENGIEDAVNTSSGKLELDFSSEDPPTFAGDTTTTHQKETML